MKQKWYSPTSGERFEVEFDPYIPHRLYVRDEADGLEGDWVTLYLEQGTATTVPQAVETAISEDPEACGWMAELWPVPEHLLAQA